MKKRKIPGMDLTNPVPTFDAKQVLTSEPFRVGVIQKQNASLLVVKSSADANTELTLRQVGDSAQIVHVNFLDRGSQNPTMLSMSECVKIASALYDRVGCIKFEKFSSDFSAIERNTGKGLTSRKGTARVFSARFPLFSDPNTVSVESISSAFRNRYKDAARRQVPQSYVTAYSYQDRDTHLQRCNIFKVLHQQQAGPRLIRDFCHGGFSFFLFEFLPSVVSLSTFKYLCANETPSRFSVELRRKVRSSLQDMMEYVFLQHPDLNLHCPKGPSQLMDDFMVDTRTGRVHLHDISALFKVCSDPGRKMTFLGLGQNPTRGTFNENRSFNRLLDVFSEMSNAIPL